MARPLHSSAITALQGATLILGIIAEFDFPSGKVRIWTGLGNLSWDSQTWTGLGDLVGVGDIEETTEIGAAGLTLNLNVGQANIVSLALGERYRGRPCRLWLALMSNSTTVGHAIPLFGGRMDVMDITEEGEGGSIVLSVENRLADLRRPRTSRYTHAEQLRRYPGDLFFEFSAKLHERPIPWATPGGGSRVAQGGGTAPGGSTLDYVVR